ncbi:GtrA family protein [Arcobacter arenosus]|uniref:GtrA family protein n=1 Tax=Arcobacter arenosus TaxID=2576037 RepID=UPI003BACF4E5
MNIKRFINLKLFNYFVIGGISTLIHFLVAFIYIHFINNSLYESNIIAFFIAYVFSYIFQSKFVFKKSINKTKAFKYFIVQFFSLLLAIWISYLFKDFNNYIKTIIVVIIMPLLTFTIHKLWTFKE